MLEYWRVRLTLQGVRLESTRAVSSWGRSRERGAYVGAVTAAGW
jgi:hypothetical protein